MQTLPKSSFPIPTNGASQLGLALAGQYLATLPPRQQQIILGLGFVGFGLYLLSRT